MESIAEVFNAPLRISAYADAKWRQICRATPKRLEVYAFLLSNISDDPFTIVDMDCPPQEVSGGRCTVVANDVLGAGERIARDGLVVAGSIHRHPFGMARLSGTDEELLEGMAYELGSDLVVPIRLKRPVRDLTLTVDRPGDMLSPSGQAMEPGVYTAPDVTIEETILASRVYCCVWSPASGYCAASANILYDPVGGTRREYSYVEEIIVEKPSGGPMPDGRKTSRLVKKMVSESSWQHAAEFREMERCSPIQ